MRRFLREAIYKRLFKDGVVYDIPFAAILLSKIIPLLDSIVFFLNLSIFHHQQLCDSRPSNVPL